MSNELEQLESKLEKKMGFRNMQEKLESNIFQAPNYGNDRRISHSNFSCMFLNPIFFFTLNSNCPDLLDLRNLQKQVKKAFCYQKLF